MGGRKVLANWRLIFGGTETQWWSFYPQNCQSNWLHSMWKSPWDWKLFSTGGASARSLWKQWQHQAIPSRSCQRLSSKLPVGHKKIGKKSFLMLNVHHNNIGDGQIWIPSSRSGGSLFHFWIALFPTRLKLGISFAFHYSSSSRVNCILTREEKTSKK